MLVLNSYGLRANKTLIRVPQLEELGIQVFQAKSRNVVYCIALLSLEEQEPLS